MLHLASTARAPRRRRVFREAATSNALIAHRKFRAALDAAALPALREARDAIAADLDRIREVIAATPPDRFNAAFLPRIEAQLEAMREDLDSRIELALRDGVRGGAAAGTAALPTPPPGALGTSAFAFTGIEETVVAAAIANAGELVTGVGETLRRSVMREVRLAVVGGQTQYDAILAVQSTLDKAGAAASVFRSTFYRAETIVRTETNRAGNVVQLEGAARVNASFPGMFGKTWVTARDDRVRPSHEALDGVTIPVEDQFDVGGIPADGPMDPGLPAEEAINCRCTIVIGVRE